MNKLVISIAAAIMLCTFDIGGAAKKGAECNKGCICSFLTVPASSDESDSEDIEYGFKLYELIKKLFE